MYRNIVVKNLPVCQRCGYQGYLSHGWRSLESPRFRLVDISRPIRLNLRLPLLLLQQSNIGKKRPAALLVLQNHLLQLSHHHALICLAVCLAPLVLWALQKSMHIAYNNTLVQILTCTHFINVYKFLSNVMNLVPISECMDQLLQLGLKPPQLLVLLLHTYTFIN